MILEKKLTIKEIFEIIEKLSNEIDNELLRKQINYYKILPSSIKIKEIITTNKSNISDKFLRYMIKKEDINFSIESKIESLKYYQDLLLNRIEEKDINSYHETIVYFRNKGYTWNQIKGLFEKANINFSERKIRRIYSGK